MEQIIGKDATLTVFLNGKKLDIPCESFDDDAQGAFQLLEPRLLVGEDRQAILFPAAQEDR